MATKKSSLQELKTRLEVELEDLQEKMSSLNEFIESSDFQNTGEIQQLLLQTQTRVMAVYEQILLARYNLL